MPRVVLLIPTSTYRAPDFVRAAVALGVEIVIASERRQALAAGMRDRALVVPFDDPEEAARRIVAAAPVDAVVAIDEAGVVPAALAAEKLGLVANPPEAVAATKDKAVMRHLLEKAGVPQPRHTVAMSGDDLGAVGFPCVLKPVGLSASRGVIRADSPGEAEEAAARIRRIVDDADAPVLVEEYVEGTEVSVEGLLRDGHLEVLAVFDKPEPMEGPLFAETILVTPSSQPIERITDVVVAAVTALGLRQGPVHAEARVTPNGDVRFLEVGARSIGGLCARALRFVSGMTLEEIILRHAARLPLADLAREEAASGVCMLYPPRAGLFREVQGQDEALAVPGVTDFELTVSPGSEVEALPDSARYLGFLFARGPEPAMVVAALQEARGYLDIVVE